MHFLEKDYLINKQNLLLNVSWITWGWISPVSHLFATPKHPEEWRCIAREEQGSTSHHILQLSPWPAGKFVTWADSCCNFFLQGDQKLVMKTNKDKRWSGCRECHPLVTSPKSHMNFECQERVRWGSGHLIHMGNAFCSKSTTAHCCLSWRRWSQGNYTLPARSLLTSLLVI